MPPRMSILYCTTDYSLVGRFNKVVRRMKREPVFAPSAEAAWQLIEDGQSFGLIICDHRPPKLDGLAFLRRVRAHQATATTRFVLHTLSKDPDLPPEVAALSATFELQGTERLWEDQIPEWLEIPSAA